MKKKIFISYCRSDADTDQIKQLKDKLQKDGFEVIIDDGVLRHGHEVTEFMEKSIRESKYILVICTSEYKNRADNRGSNPTGVAYEARLLASHINKKTKIVIPIIQGTEISVLPDFLEGIFALFLKQINTNKESYNKLLDSLKEEKEQELEFTKDFKEKLNSMEILSNSHNAKETLFLEDIFVYPKLTNIEKDIKNSDSYKFFSSKKISEKLENEKYIMISGDAQSGKTTLSKKITKDLFDEGYIPILINQSENLTNNFKRILEIIINKQYKNLENTENEKDKFVIIIDDFHLLKKKDKILNDVLKFNYIILLTDDIYSLNLKREKILNFSKYRIMEFSPKLRDELIKKWSNLKDEVSNENEIMKKNDKRTEFLNTTIGKIFNNGIMPAYPFFLLSVLGYSETNKNLDKEITSQGYCYQFLIQMNFWKNGIRNDAIDIYLNFLSELSYYVFSKNIYELYQTDIDKFLENYEKNFNLVFDSEEVINSLIKSKILKKTSLGSIKFFYPYLYYYFIGKYLSEHYKEEENSINKLVRNLHLDRNSYICIFISHHSKEKRLLEEILLNSLELFENSKVTTLKIDEMKEININFDNILESFLPEVNDFNEIREKNIQLEEISENTEIDEESLYVDSDNEIEDEDIYNFRRSIRTVEVIGNLAKNRPGSLEKTLLKEMILYSIELNLRILNFILYQIKDEEFQKYMLELIEKGIGKLEIKSKNNTKELAKRIFWELCYNLIFFIIYKTIHSIGSDYLMKIINEISKDKKTPAISLIKHGIRMWYMKEVDINEIKNEIKEYNYSKIAENLMRHLLIMHCSTHPMDYKSRDRIMNTFQLNEKKYIGGLIKK